MNAESLPAQPPSYRKARYVVALTGAVGLVITLGITLVGFEPSYTNDALHVAKETTAALVLLLVVALLIGRFRRSGSLLDLFALAGVLLLASKNLFFSVAGAIATETEGGVATWRTAGAGMLGAALLAAAALVPGRVVRARHRAVIMTALGSFAGLALLTGVAFIFDLPSVFSEQPETTADLERFGEHPGLMIADASAAVLFVVAGAGFARRADREVDEFLLWLGVGSMIAGIGYLNFVLVSPSSYTDFLYTGDVFRIFAVLAWGIGTIREIAVYQAAYTEAAVLDERRRVARDLHDGVAQELAFISSQMHWLRKQPDDEEATGQIMEAVQRALDESRGAISTLSRPIHQSLDTALASTAEEVADRLGARLNLDLDRGIRVSPAWEEALPRILREAVANAVRHGHAGTINVHLRNGDGVWLRITDDGQGFDPTKPRSENSFGLISMRERTEALGGEFKVSSQPGRGTSVEVVLP